MLVVFGLGLYLCLVGVPDRCFAFVQRIVAVVQGFVPLVDWIMESGEFGVEIGLWARRLVVWCCWEVI